jgi:hypothetical protein
MAGRARGVVSARVAHRQDAGTPRLRDAGPPASSGRGPGTTPALGSGHHGHRSICIRPAMNGGNLMGTTSMAGADHCLPTLNGWHQLRWQP